MLNGTQRKQKEDRVREVRFILGALHLDSPLFLIRMEGECELNLA